MRQVSIHGSIGLGLTASTCDLLLPVRYASHHNCKEVDDEHEHEVSTILSWSTELADDNRYIALERHHVEAQQSVLASIH